MNIKSFYVEIDKDIIWRLCLVLCIIGIIIASSDVVVAEDPKKNTGDTASYDVIGNTLCRLVKNLSGNIAKAIATIAIFAVGVGLFLGKLNWGVAAATAGGVGIIFSANKLVAFLTDSGGNADCAGYIS
jgi:type IV secretory pathway VirB2 component (pilin)